MSTLPEPQVLDPEDLQLEYTHGVRKQLVDTMIKNGMPSEPKDKMILLSALDGIDRAALGKKRIKSDEKIGNLQSQAAGLIATILNKTAGIKPYQSPVPVEREAPVLGEEIPEPQVVDGEMATNPPQSNYEQFMKKTDYVEPESS